LRGASISIGSALWKLHPNARNPSIKGADSGTVEDNLIRANAANGVRVASIRRSTLARSELT
jgi:hypothetical protein